MADLNPTSISISQLIDQILCPHSDVLRKTEGKRFFTECMRCGQTSCGVETGGHVYTFQLRLWPAELSGMRKASFMILAAFIMFTSLYSRADCSIYNTSLGPFLHGAADASQHATGNHSASNVTAGTCKYSGSSACSLTASASSAPSYNEGGVLTLGGYHVAGKNLADGSATAQSGYSASAGTTGAVAFEHCLTPYCTVSVSISTPGGGASFPSGAVWAYQNIYTNNCPGRTYKSTRGCGDGGTFIANCCLSGCGSPIVIDTRGTGFHFTNPTKDCVFFDLGDGLKCLSWPRPGSGVGFLVLDPPNGQVTNKEIFGNLSAHADSDIPGHPDPNGFLALAWYDKPEQGGNLDGQIDQRDQVWSHLRLWIDKHCLRDASPYVSRPDELHTLDEFGIRSLSLVYEVGKGLDRWGNNFKFSAPINVTEKDQQHSKDSRMAYDVFMVGK